MRWQWLTSPKTPYNLRFFRNVVIKALILFILINVVYVVLRPLPRLSTLTLYNQVLPGRERFPYSEDPSETYSVTLSGMDAMFASHVIAGDTKPGNEFRVVMLGDSSVWGWLLEPSQTPAACLNANNHLTDDGRKLRVYNLGYPALSVFKDAVILEEALNYTPDAVVWLVTLQTLFDIEQLRHPIMQNNADRARDFIQTYQLDMNIDELPAESFWDRTIVGQRRDLADLIRHQIYGLAWWMTRRDHAQVEFIGTPMLNLPPSEGILNREDLAIGEFAPGVVRWDVLQAGINLVLEQNVPVLLVNQPILVSEGLNSDLRYNEYYPRWAYDLYREQLHDVVQAADWDFVDLWNAVAAEDFTDTPFHYDAEATCEFARQLTTEILRLANLQ